MNKSFTKTIISLSMLTIVICLFSFCTPFCNFYTNFIFPVINSALVYLTRWCPVAIGELIMYLAGISLIMEIVFLLIFIFLHKRPKFKAFFKTYSRFLLFFFVLSLFVYSITWFIPFRASVYVVDKDGPTSFSETTLLEMYENVVNEINELAYQVERDENGHLVMNDIDKRVMDALCESRDLFPRFKGPFSPIKTALCSDWLHWMGIGGYNYPYTMEPTVNKYVSLFYYPVLAAHELCHHKGYEQECEGEYISIIALSRSSDKLLRYLGLCEAFDYINIATFKDMDLDVLKAIYPTVTKLNQIVFDDRNYYDNLAIDYYQNTVDTEKENAFSEITGDISDIGWNIQDNILKENSYSGATLMLLQYFYNELPNKKNK